VDHRKASLIGPEEASPLGKYRNNYCSPGQEPETSVWGLMRYLWHRSALPMVRKCHRVPHGTGIDVFRKWHEDGSHSISYMGFCRCASVWACPMCAPRIRRRRAQILASELIGAVSAGRGLVFATFTVPHDQGTDLGALFTAVTTAWQDVRADRRVSAFFGDYGVDFARCTEVTWGLNGFHPHLHVAIVLRSPLSRDQVQELRRIMFDPWCRSVQRSGFRAPSWKAGVHCINVLRGTGNAEALAEYMSKIEGLANELTRLDRKSASGHRTIGPFEVLRRASDGDERMASVWHDYEAGTKGRRALSYSQTWRTRVSDLVVPTDGELALPVDDRGEWVGMLANDEAAALSSVPYGHEVFMELLGDESPEAFRKATEWLCLELEDLRWHDERFPEFSTKRARMIYEARANEREKEQMRVWEETQPRQEVMF